MDSAGKTGQHSWNMLIVIVIHLLCFSVGFGQPFTKAEQAAVVEKILDLIATHYVDEASIPLITDSLRGAGYDGMDRSAFARRLSRDLRRFSQDQHFQVFYNAGSNFSNAITQGSRQTNYGFVKAELLKGNIGYLKIISFEDPEIAAETASSAMGFLSNADAVIVDLRDNNGGRKAMVQFLLSYFFEEPSKLLYTIIGRQEKFFGYTEVDVPGKRMSAVPLFVVVNGRTFSAAELFAFVLQKNERAVIVGNKTSGGGHTVANYQLGEGMAINVPVGRVLDPISMTGWQSAGIQPDVGVENGKYVEQAWLLALEKRLISEQDSSERFTLRWQADILTSELKPHTISIERLRGFAGQYGRRIVSFADGKLFYQGRTGIEKAELIPIDDHTFRFSEADFFRIQFVVDDNGSVSGLKGLYDDGFEDFSGRNK